MKEAFKDTSEIPQIVVRETWIWYTWPDRMTYTLMQMFRRYAYIGCKNEKVKIGEKKVSLDFCKLLPKEFWEERKKFFFWNCGPGYFQAEFARSGCILSSTLCFFALTVMKLISSWHWCNEANLYCRLKARCLVQFNRHLNEPDIDLL